MWQPGDLLTHRTNPDLGIGRVVALDGRSVEVRFAESGQTLRFAASSDALLPLTLTEGGQARIEATGQIVTLAEPLSDGRWRLSSGRTITAAELVPLPAELLPLERLERGLLDGAEDFVNRLDGLRLARLREARGLGSFLGGRIRLFPHQLYAAEKACASPGAVRWLLADEVGLGKTVEACLILNRLIHTRRAERVLVVAPETLTLQWLGELWRKHHQVFALLDGPRLADVARDHGPGFNPFDVHRRAVLSLERLADDRKLAEQAAAAGIDLLVVDEAHHLKRPPGHPGNPAYRAVAAIAALGRSVLLLTATPLEDDAHGFFRLLQLLRPDVYPESESFDDRLARRAPLPPCTSATRRADIGGLPPRVAAPVEGDADDAGWQALLALERRVRETPAGSAPESPVQRRKRAERIRRAAASPAALAAVLDRSDPRDQETAALAAQAERHDPRLRFLADRLAPWQRAGDKTLVFVADRETLEAVKAALEQRTTARVGLFHEGLSAERRDIEVAQFRLPEGPSLLLSTEAGGEGRNFELCRRLVLFDLPWSPGVVEQRIGRLDRIGRTLPTEIVYFRPPAGLVRAIADLYAAIGLFRQPLGGLERELRHAARAVEEVALGGDGEIAPDAFAAVLGEAQAAQTRVQEAAYGELHRDPYRAAMAAAILARVPPELESLTADVVLRAAARFGFAVEAQSGHATWLVEHGSEALVDHLPGVPAESRFLGTFDREEAVDHETRDFFASGHPLVEGVLAELEDGPRGRASALQLAGDEELFGLLALYRRAGPDGSVFSAVAVDAAGRLRPDLAARWTTEPLACEPFDVRKWTGQAAWANTIRKLVAALPAGEAPEAVAAFRLRKRGAAGTVGKGVR